MSNTAKNLAQQIAKQMAQEPFELLRNVKEQVSGETVFENPQKPLEENKKLENQQQEINDKLKSSRRMEAYARELEDIRKQDVFKDLQQRISQGEEIPLNDYSELTIEQKQVLQAQMEAVRIQMAKNQMTNDKLIVLTSKKGRRFGGGQKQQAQKEQTRVEKPIPPSG